MKFSKLIAILASAAALVIGAHANASIVTYHLASTFNSGAVVDGTFVFNNATRQVTSFLINVGAAPENGYCDGWFCDGFAAAQTYSSAAGDRGFLNGGSWLSFSKNIELSYLPYGEEEQTTALINFQFSLSIGNYNSTIGQLTSPTLVSNMEESRYFYTDDLLHLSGASRDSGGSRNLTLVSLVEPAPPVKVPPARAVPEPGTLALLAAGLGLLGLTRRRRVA